MDINQFYIAGINYKKTDASSRGQFAVSSFHYASLLQKASLVNVSQLFVLSTCNRTEIYGIASNADYTGLLALLFAIFVKVNHGTGLARSVVFNARHM